MKQFVRLEWKFRYTKLIFAKKILEFFFLIKYIVKTEKKPLRISLKCAYRTINRGLCDEKFVKLDPNQR